MLNMTSGIHEMGGMQWPLIICSGVSWFTCFMCLFKGIKSMGKAVIFTTIFSYVILTVLLIRGVTLPGAIDGIIFYLKPDFKKLAHLQVWGEASAQVFASLSLGGGGWITLSSYNKFKNKCNRCAAFVLVVEFIYFFVFCLQRCCFGWRRQRFDVVLRWLCDFQRVGLHGVCEGRAG